FLPLVRGAAKLIPSVVCAISKRC
uniref:Brevinin-1SE n=1 Tax=Lithobates sevosus TaxID=299683 RepID=BR1_LITSE|nr:RecName: Full=Brevinin-1SE [Lithobates sevosus]